MFMNRLAGPDLGEDMTSAEKVVAQFIHSAGPELEGCVSLSWGGVHAGCISMGLVSTPS